MESDRHSLEHCQLLQTEKALGRAIKYSGPKERATYSAKAPARPKPGAGNPKTWR